MNWSTVLWASRRKQQFCKCWSMTAAAAQNYFHGFLVLNTDCCNYSSLSRSSVIRQLNNSPNTLVEYNNNNNKNAKLLLLTNKSNNYSRAAKSPPSSSKSSLPQKVYGVKSLVKKDEYLIVKKAMLFRRSFKQDILDGTITDTIGDRQLIIDFDDFKWLCDIPAENKTNYPLRSHVTVQKVDAIALEKVPVSSIMILRGTKIVEPDELTGSFPWKLTRPEKNFLMDLVTMSFLLTGFFIFVVLMLTIGVHEVMPWLTDFTLFKSSSSSDDDSPPS